MIPLVDGTEYHFEWRGLYDGVSILMDRESGSLWHHVSGVALDGPLAGATLGVFNLLHMSAGTARANYDDLEVVMSDRPIAGRPGRWWPLLERVPMIGDRFRSTMAPEDTRRPTMDVGLGVWNEGGNRYYPMEVVASEGNVLLDELGGRRILVFYQPGSVAMSAVYTTADGASRQPDGTLLLSDGTQIRDGVLRTPDGSRIDPHRPMQLFTRWYGYALTFPETEVFRR